MLRVLAPIVLLIGIRSSTGSAGGCVGITRWSGHILLYGFIGRAGQG